MLHRHACHLCSSVATTTTLLLLVASTMCSNSILVRACDAEQHEIVSTSPARAPRLRPRQPQMASGDLPVAGAAAPSAPEETSSTSSGLPVGNASPLPEGYTMPEPFEWAERSSPLKKTHRLSTSPSSAILGVNFTSNSCPTFFNTFLGDPDFKACHPLSSLVGCKAHLGGRKAERYTRNSSRRQARFSRQCKIQRHYLP